jgi:hypothetical protein
MVNILEKKLPEKTDHTEFVKEIDELRLLIKELNINISNIKSQQSQ